jgi:spermidine synthase
VAKPWRIIDTVCVDDGVLELRQRGERDFLMLINGRVLMSSSANRSETALGEHACGALPARREPRVLVAGLGMGLTLRAVLDFLPLSASVIVAELNPVIVSWCRGPLAGLSANALGDPRVSVVIDDVAALIGKAALPGEQKFDAIVLDLYEGPHAKSDARNDPFYGSRALERTAAALAEGGIFAVWGEIPDAAFEKRLAVAGFSFDRQRPGRGGLRHVIYIAARGGAGRFSQKKG